MESREWNEQSVFYMVHIWNYYLWACIPNSIVFRLNRKIVVVAMERKTQFALHIAQLSLGNCANGHMVFQVIEWMFHSTSCSRVTTLWMEDTYIQYHTKLPASIDSNILHWHRMHSVSTNWNHFKLIWLCTVLYIQFRCAAPISSACISPNRFLYCYSNSQFTCLYGCTSSKPHRLDYCHHYYQQWLNKVFAFQTKFWFKCIGGCAMAWHVL